MTENASKSSDTSGLDQRVAEFLQFTAHNETVLEILAASKRSADAAIENLHARWQAEFKERELQTKLARLSSLEASSLIELAHEEIGENEVNWSDFCRGVEFALKQITRVVAP